MRGPSELPVLSVRREIQVYARSCESLLSGSCLEEPLSDDERWVIRYYMAELARELKAA